MSAAMPTAPAASLVGPPSLRSQPPALPVPTGDHDNGSEETDGDVAIAPPADEDDASDSPDGSDSDMSPADEDDASDSPGGSNSEGYQDQLRPMIPRSSGDPLVDFFFNVVPGTATDRVTSLLAGAWEKDPLTSLKLICNLRGVRGSGKADRAGFYAAALWLHSAHPRTLAGNLAAFAEFGYLKDLLEILVQVLRSSGDVEEGKRMGSSAWQSGRRIRRRRLNSGEPELTAEKKAEAAAAKRQKTVDAAAKAISLYSTDENFRFLYDSVAELFASLLKSDVERMNSDEAGAAKISLAAKWCPSLDSSYDRATLICEAIAKRLFPRDSCAEFAGIADEHYAYRVRNKLRKEVLTPLRKRLALPEAYISAGEWQALPYDRVASVAMKRYGQLFVSKDKSRVNGFFNEVRRGAARMSAGALLPHEIIAAAKSAKVGGDQTAELQWRDMVAALSRAGKLTNCIAVCRGGSEVSLALGLLVSELSEEPWKGRVITFVSSPKLHKIRGKTVREKICALEEEMPAVWVSAHVQEVFDQILRVAVDGKLPADKMVRRVFVFSDNEGWDVDYNAIQGKFAAAGYGDATPAVVIWNVGASEGTPVLSAQKGVALVSGYSKNLVKLFVSADGELTPEAVMKDAIAGPEYDNLAVLD